jgi:hypothetical protein
MDSVNQRYGLTSGGKAAMAAAESIQIDRVESKERNESQGKSDLCPRSVVAMCRRRSKADEYRKNDLAIRPARRARTLRESPVAILEAAGRRAAAT